MVHKTETYLSLLAAGEVNLQARILKQELDVAMQPCRLHSGKDHASEVQLAEGFLFD